MYFDRLKKYYLTLKNFIVPFRGIIYLDIFYVIWIHNSVITANGNCELRYFLRLDPDKSVF